MLWFPKGGSGPHGTAKSYHPRLLWVPGRWDAAGERPWQVNSAGDLMSRPGQDRHG